MNSGTLFLLIAIYNDNRDAQKPVDDSYFEYLRDNDLIVLIPEGEYAISDRGRVYIRSLIKVPLPIEDTKWITDWDKIDDN